MYAVRFEDKIRVYDAYLYRDGLKSVPGRFYDADEKAWVLPMTTESVATLQLLGARLDDRLDALIAEEPKHNPETAHPKPRVKATLYKHQEQAYAFALDTLNKGKALAILAEMGTGKTLITIATAGTLYEQGRIGKLLVVCPKSIVGVWEEEFRKFADYKYALTVLDGTLDKKKAAFGYMNGSGLQVIVVNYESCWRLEKEIAKWQPDIIVCDESSKIKNPQTSQSKALHRLGKQTKYYVILTGTPITNNPLDFFSQYKFLDESIYGSSYFLFRARYAILGGYQRHQIVGYQNLAELVTKAHRIALRIKIADAVDLPPYIDEIRNIRLEDKAQVIYNNLAKDCYAQLAGGEVMVRNVLTQLLRLSQCTGGYIRGDIDSTAQEVSRAKLDALEDVLESCMEEGKKVVVFARFVPEIDAIEKLLKRKGIGYSLIKGDVKDRAEQVERFQTDENVRVFVGQLQTTGMGLTLTAASVAVYYSLDFSYANYEQSRARIHRIGQKEKCLYIHLICKGTVDEKIMAALRHKQSIATLVTDNWRSLING